MTISIKTTVLGEKECAATFARAGTEVRAELAAELDAIGREGVTRARAGVPKRSRRTEQNILYYTGRLAARTIREYGSWKDDGNLRLLILPGEPTAHLIERGVNATITRRRDKGGDVYSYTERLRRSRRTGLTELVPAKRGRHLVASGVKFVKPYQLRITARPYFTPAMESLGDVGARLQAAVSRASAKSQGAL